MPKFQRIVKNRCHKCNTPLTSRNKSGYCLKDLYIYRQNQKISRLSRVGGNRKPTPTKGGTSLTWELMSQILTGQTLRQVTYT